MGGAGLRVHETTPNTPNRILSPTGNTDEDCDSQSPGPTRALQNTSHLEELLPAREPSKSTKPISKPGKLSLTTLMNTKGCQSQWPEALETYSSIPFSDQKLQNPPRVRVKAANTLKGLGFRVAGTIIARRPFANSEFRPRLRLSLQRLPSLTGVLDTGSLRIP